MADLHVRIPDDINAKLSTLAKKKRLSKNNLLKAVITDYALNPEIKNIENKYDNLVRDVAALYQAELEKVREQIEDNNYILQQVIDKL